MTEEILIVDDDEPTRAAIEHVVRRAGYDTRTAAGGAEGLAAAVELTPALVLADVVMPGIDGPELCRRIKAHPLLQGTLVVLYSAHRTSSPEQADGLDAGADGYIARPISNRELVARVHSYMRLRRAEAERDRVIAELREALANVRALSGLIPICVRCKKIRDDEGYWNRLEKFLESHSDVQFSHAVCPDCLKVCFPPER